MVKKFYLIIGIIITVCKLERFLEAKNKLEVSTADMIIAAITNIIIWPIPLLKALITRSH